MKHDDAKLIQRVLAGDDTAFSALVKKHQKPVHALAWRKTGDFHIAEEITQDTFLKAYQNLSTLKEPQKFAGWLYVIAANYCKMWRRKKRLSTQSLEDTDSAELERATYSGYVIAENERTTAEAQREVVKQLLAKLQESDRIVITLYYLGGMTYEEISEFLGVSVSTIKSRLYRARQRLKKEEPMIRETLGSFQITPNLTENIMREISRLKPVTPPNSKPLVPWVLAASTLAVVFLMLGIGSQYLSRFQKPYSFDAVSEMTVELIEAPIVLNLESKPDVRTQLGNVNAPSKSDTSNQQPNDVSASAADANSAETDIDYSQWQLPEDAKFRLGKGLLHDIKYTPDGNRIAIATSIGIWIYDAQTGEALTLLTGHTARVTSLGFPADGRFLASGSFDRTVRLWDIDTGEQTALFAGHRAGIGAIAVSPDGKTVVSGDSTWKGVLILWDVETGEQIKRHTIYTDNLIHRFKIWIDKSRTVPNPNAIEAIAFSPDGETFVSGHRDGTARLWDAETGRKISAFREHKRAGINDVAFSPDGKILMSSTYDGTVLQTFQKGKRLARKMSYVPFPEHLVFSPDGTHIIGSGYLGRETIGKKRFVHKWDAVTGRLLMSTPTAHTDQLMALAVSPDGSTILTGSWDGTIHQWDTATGTHLSTFATGHGRGGRALMFSEDGQTLISTLGRWGHEAQLMSWDTTTGVQIPAPDFKEMRGKRSSNLPNRVVSAKIDEDRKHIQVQEVATGREMYRITKHKGDIWTFAFSPDRKILASGSEDMTIRLWDAITGNKILTLPTYTYEVFAVAFSPDGKILAGGSVYDSQLGRSDLIRLWEIPSGRILATLTGHTSTVRVLRFSPDGKILASSSSDGTILLWDLDRTVQIKR
ncbi:MAG: sigma-70 family RNA polymerase sigma factor [Candidatus Poribacteria bacterium]|nr:sigma-70 family RNA polymerase sigma factor [Candidatus Poribacteria bacterium]